MEAATTRQEEKGASSSSVVVDEAYRRQGRRLSDLAHGEVPSKPPFAVRIEPNASSPFHSYARPEPAARMVVPRSATSAPLRRLVYEARNSFRRWKDTKDLRGSSGTATHRNCGQQEEKYSLPEEEKYSQQEPTGFARLSLHENSQTWARRPEQDVSHWGRGAGGRPGVPANGKGFLSSVLEGHSDSATSVTGPAGGAHNRSTHTRASQSISTKDSRTVYSSSTTGGNGASYGNGGYSNGNGSVGHDNGSESGAPVLPIARGKCLTGPTEGVANGGLDNLEGNLIVYENDILEIPPKSMHTFSASKEIRRRRKNDYRIQKLLGQGTFAHVFQCLHVQTGELVAIKVVKNKPAYTRQATVEIDVFRALQEEKKKTGSDATSSTEADSTGSHDYMVSMNCYFMYQSHLCLVFQLLGLNLYEVLKRRQFTGFPLLVVQSIVHQSLHGVKELAQRSIVHCDLKPENILLVSEDVVKAVVNSGDSPRRHAGAALESDNASTTSKAASGSVGPSSVSEASEGTRPSSEISRADTVQAANDPSLVDSLDRGVKLIDFGSACFEGHTAHTYIQSRFYRSPEVILGLPYDSAVDMWSLGCVAAELFLGLPILPGVHEHDQLGRIEEMINKIPDWMLDQGSKATKYYVNFVARPTVNTNGASAPGGVQPTGLAPAPTPPLPQWRMKTLPEFIRSLDQSDIEKKGGLTKLQKPPGNRYFRKKSLSGILNLHSSNLPEDERILLAAFEHFLLGVLDPDPWKRWTAFQAVQHPFITGQLVQLRKKNADMRLEARETNQANLILNYYWKAPWDPAICRRKLLNVQKMREKQQVVRRTLSNRSPSNDASRRTRPGDPSLSSFTSRRQATATDPSLFIGQLGLPYPNPPTTTASSLRSVGATGERRLLTREGGTIVGSHEEIFMNQGPQSLTSDVGQPFVESDFGYALLRPGVVPGSSMGTSMSSQHAPRSQAYAQVTHATSVPKTTSDWMQSGFGASGQETGYPRGIGNQFDTWTVASSAASSVTAETNTGPFLHSGSVYNIPPQAMQQVSYADPHQFAMAQQQQFSGMQQAQEGTQAAAYQQSLHASQSQVPSGIHHQQSGQIGMQQAPVVTQVAAPGGGYFFVTTSPSGQAMVLQPVAFLNQQSQQMPMYSGQMQGVQGLQGQQASGQMMQGQYVGGQFVQIPQGQMQPGQSVMDQMSVDQMSVDQMSVGQMGVYQHQQQFYQPQQVYQQSQQFYQPQMQQQVFNPGLAQEPYGSTRSQGPDESSQASFRSNDPNNPRGQGHFPEGRR
jgi:serine/threonine protein kinase